jgi:hypothetical protein
MASTPAGLVVAALPDDYLGDAPTPGDQTTSSMTANILGTTSTDHRGHWRPAPPGVTLRRASRR